MVTVYHLLPGSKDDNGQRQSHRTGALNNSIHTILTSGAILVIVTAVLGFMMASGQPAVSEILLTISRGAIFATLLVIFILPCLISVFDRFVMGKKRMQKLNENAAANLSTDTSME